MNEGKNGIVDIDICKSAIFKDCKSQKEMDETFGEYHSTVEKNFEIFNGKCWYKVENDRIFFFPTINDAVDACLRLLNDLTLFNTEKNKQSFPLFVRIGVHEIETKNIADVPENEKSKFVQKALDVVRKLQNNCPIGKIAISTEVYENIRGIKLGIFRPALSSELSKMRAFVLRCHPLMPQEEFLLKGLPNEQKMSIPLIPFTTWDKIIPDENLNLTMLDKILEQPLLVILGETSLHPQSPISSAATSDAVGIIEILSDISNAEVIAGIDQWEDTSDLVYNYNILLVGSSIVNTYAFTLNDLIKPIHFVKAGGQVFDKIIATSEDKQKYFGPHTKSPRDCGMVVISKSPFNLDKILLWIGGITGMGTHAATMLVHELIHNPQAIMRHKIGKSLLYPIGCVVSPGISEGSRENKRLRIRDYEILWMVDRYGKAFESSETINAKHSLRSQSPLHTDFVPLLPIYNKSEQY